MICKRGGSFSGFYQRGSHARGEPVTERSPEEAGEVLASVVAENRFTLYEYSSLTLGHDQIVKVRARPHETGGNDRTTLATRSERTTVILTSDHGNIGICPRATTHRTQCQQ